MLGLKTWPETMSLDCWCCSWVEAFSCSWMMGWSLSCLPGPTPTLVHSGCGHQKTGTDGRHHPHPLHSYVTVGHHHLDPLHTAQPCYCWTSPSPPPVQLCITRELHLHAKWLDCCADPVMLASTLIMLRQNTSTCSIIFW